MIKKFKQQKHTILIVAIFMIATLFLLTTLIQTKEHKITEEKVNAYSIAPSTATSHTQTNTYTVKSEKSVYVGAGTYWYQLGDMKWRADTEFGTITVPNKNNYPTPTVVKERHDLSSWQLQGEQIFWSDNGRFFNGPQLNEKFIASANDAKFRNVKSFSGKGIQVEHGTNVILNFESGYGYTPTTYGLLKGSKTRHEAMYLTPFDVYWSGRVIETYEISTDPNFTMNVGATKNIWAFVRSKTGKDAWTGYRNVTTDSGITWKSDNPSVATVDNKGLVKALKKGTASIHATWKSGDYHITTKTVVTVDSAPSMSIEGTTNMCFDNGQTILGAYYYEKDSPLNITSLSETVWDSSNKNVASVNKGIVTFKAVGKTTITVTYKGISTKVTVTVNDCSEPPTPEEPTPEIVPENLPPIVNVEGNTTVDVGSNVCFYAVASDPDGYIIQYDWMASGFVKINTSSSTICGYYETQGSKTVHVTVTDNGDIKGENHKTASASHTINVTVPSPQAYVHVSGTLKENRKITITPNHTYGGNATAYEKYPIVKQTLVIEAVDETNETKLKITENIDGNVDHTRNIPILSKFTGKVKISRYVENNLGQSDSYETTITIAPDLVPTADFDVTTLTYREPKENDVAEATISIYDRSHSQDDEIQKRIYRLKYDSNNDGSFDDEEWIILSEENEEKIEYKTTKVGKYLIELEVWEKFSQETIGEFVDLTFNKETTDLRYNDTSKKEVTQKVVEIDNLEPTVSLDLKAKKVAEVQFDTTNSPFPKDVLKANLPYLKQKLMQENIDLVLNELESSGVKEISNSYMSTYILLEDGTVYVTGNNSFGALGTGDFGYYYSPTKLTTLSGKVKALSRNSSSSFTHFLMEDGSVYGTGSNSNGNLGIGNNSPQTTPQKVINLPSKVKDVYTGTTSYFLLEDGTVYATGYNGYGGLGNGVLQNEYSPIKVNLPLKVKSMSNGTYHVHFLMEDGTVYGLGYNEFGELGDGTTIQRNRPVKINLPLKVKSIASGSNHTIFLLENGTVYSTGMNTFGQLGLGNTAPYYTPTRISSLTKKVKEVVTGQSNTIFILEDGTIYGTGYNYLYDLALPSQSIYMSPTLITALSGKVKSIYKGGLHTHVIMNDGYTYAIGNNQQGQLGLGHTISPIRTLTKVPNIPQTLQLYKNTNLTLFAIGLNQQGNTDYFKNTLSKVTEAYFIGGGIPANKMTFENVIQWNNNRGQFIEITPTNTNENVKAFYDQLAEYIISVLSIDTQSDNSVEIEFLLDGSTGISKSALEQEISSNLKQLIAPSTTVVETEKQTDGTYKEVTNTYESTIKLHTKITEFNDNFKFGDVVQSSRNKFVVLLKTNALNSTTEQHLLATTLSNNAHLLSVGTDITSLVTKNMKKGTYIEFTNVDAALQKISDYVLKTVEANRGINELYITTDDEMNYFTSYSDYENDEMLDEYWKFEHELGYFETESGIFEQNNSKIKQPITTFNRTGQYKPHYAAQDEPLRAFNSEDKEKFEDYRKWSDEADNWRLYVHKKPSSEFSFTINATTGVYTIKNEAHDLDKASINVGYGKGLQSQKFSYRVVGGEWQDGLPSSPLKADTLYEIKNIAIDLQGEESVTIKELSRKSLPPIADFVTDKQIYSSEEIVKITNLSYDPNGDDLTAVWKVKRSDQADTKYQQFATGTLINGEANRLWNPTIDDGLFCDVSEGKSCFFTILLTVTDKLGETATVIKEVEVQAVKLVEIGFDGVEVFTAPASEGLPVYFDISEELLASGNEADAYLVPIEIEVLQDGRHYETFITTLRNLLDGTSFLIQPSVYLEKDSTYVFTFVLRSTDDKVEIDDEYERISVITKTAEEKTVKTSDVKIVYEAQISASKKVGQNQVNKKERITIRAADLQPTYTGLGVDLSHDMDVSLPTNRHYTNNLFKDVVSTITYSEVLVDAYFDEYTKVGNNAQVISEQLLLSSKQDNGTYTETTTFAYPKVFVEEGTGYVFSAAQVSNGDTRITGTLLDGGNKLYTPIWLDRLGKYDITYQLSAVGVNKIKFEITNKLPIEAYMFVHMDSPTKNKDKWLFEPVNKKNPFQNGLPKGWTVVEEEWLKD